ncbi:MAG: MFS transporter [Candidatus Hydrogenedentes bacterium]|nr:MFS transporter [Candidatus Hydrogenedentota bacterium]
MAWAGSGQASVARKGRPIRYVRWWIGGLLFLVTVINYIDRQTLSSLAPILQGEYGWSKSDYGFILNAFRVSYTVMQMVFGRVLDLIGTQHGIGISVAFYSFIGALTATAQGFRSFTFFRFLLGAGEATNNPGGAKAVSEWFPARERAWAIALFNSGCSIGGAIAPFIVLLIYRCFGTWRPAFVVTASLGFVWLIAWLKFYRKPEDHPNITDEELAYIQRGRASSVEASDAPRVTWMKVLRYRQTWGLILGRFLLDPFWFLMAEWYALYLKSKGFSLGQSVLGFWAPFMGAGLGNFFAGGLSSYFVNRGWAVGRSRRSVLLIFGPSMLMLSLATLTSNYYLLLLIFAYASFAYACCGTMFLTLPTDVFHTRAVGTVMGLAGAGAGIGTLISTFLIGWVADKISFEPVIVAASIIPCIATVIFVALIRANRKPDPEGILLHF